MLHKPLTLLALIALLGACSPKLADVLVINSTTYTVDEKNTKVQAFAIKNKQIVATGSTKQIKRKFTSDNILDAKGKFVFPGFNDAHCHFTGFATDRWKCTVTGTKSWDEVLQKISAYAKTAPMDWIYGRGWDQNDWAVKEYPDKAQLDSLFPNRPVYLKRVDGHAAIANSKAIEMAGITLNSQVVGGSFEKENGQLTGVLIDNAMWLVEKIIPEIKDDLAIRYYNELQEECLAFGLTTVQDCGISDHTVSLLEQAYATGRLKIKLYGLMEDNPDNYEKWINRGRYTNGSLTIGGYKFYADGALGSRGACLLHNYSDKPNWKGFLLSAETHFITIAQRLAASNLQMCTHAIGDSGNRVILNIYGKALVGQIDRRWRIEHAQVVDGADFSLFKKFAIVPSVQPTHATSDMYWAGDRLGDQRLKNSYAYKNLLAQNGWLPLGTDFPVEDINPFKTFYAAVFRKDAAGFPANGFQMENALSREEALRGMTIWAAKAAFQEKEKGSLEVGKAADFILLDTDLMTCPEADVLKTKVLATYIDGQKVWSKQ